MRAAAIDRSKRRLLLGAGRRAVPVVRPPWTDDDSVTAACTRCGDCIRACPERVLTVGDGGFPQLDPRTGSGECTFCGRCADSCAAAVFDRSRIPALPVLATVAAADCLAHAGIHCAICRDGCPEAAIGFPLAPGRVAVPVVAAAACTGCGACIGLCPAKALSLAERPPAGAPA